MRARRVRAAAFALCLLLAGCGGAPAGDAAISPTPSGGASSLPPGEREMKLTQEQVISKPKFRREHDGFLAQAQPFFCIPGLNQGLVPQGMAYCEADGRVYISSYVPADGCPSVITAVDAGTGKLEAEYFLYNRDGTAFTGHVGGAAASEDTLYVSAGDNSVAAIPLTELSRDGSWDLTLTEVFDVPVSPSFLSYSQGLLWVGNFYYPPGGYGLSPGMAGTTSTADGDFGSYILGYEAEAGQGLSGPKAVLIAPERVQGAVLCPDGSVLLSQSYGRKNDSTLLRCRLSLDEAPDLEMVTAGGGKVPAYILDANRVTAALTAPPMTEGVCLSPEGDALVLFESGAVRYQDGRNRTDQVWRLSLSN